MVKKHVMLPVEEVDYSKVKYKHNTVIAPSFSGWALKLFVMLLQLPLIGSLVFSSLKKLNGLTQELRNTLIPESPMFRPEFPPQDPEPDVILMEDENTPIDCVGSALTCLPCYDAAYHRTGDSSPFLYWKIRDFAHAYQSRLVTPSTVAEYVILGVEQFSNKTPPIPLLISFNAEDVRKQAEASTQRFTEGTPLSILDGIFMVVKDDIDCYPHPSTCGTTWYHKVHQVEKDAVCVSRLRSCGVIFIGKANMHELGLGVTGNNSNYGTTRNPHALDRYTGGSSSGPAALVALGLCSAALGTDAGGSLRIPSALCGVVGLKTTFGRTDVKGSICGIGTVEIIGAIAASVEDMMLVYATMSGSSPSDRISMNPPLPSIPNLSSSESLKTLKSLRLGKYTEWFNDVCSIDISDKCEDVLSQLSETHGCQIIEIVIPELHEMRTAHLVSTGSEFMSLLNPYSTYGKMIQYTPDSFITLAMFQVFSASDYVSAQRLRRRIMHYHMDIFKKVDIIVTPTTGVTAPRIPPSSLLFGESNFKLAGNLMQFIIAANLLGLPAISVPVGHDKQGLPIGLQLIGRPWGEASILRLASAIEEVSAKYRRRPSTFFDILKEN